MKSWTQIKLKRQNYERITWVESKFAILDATVKDDDGLYWYISEIYNDTNINPEIQSRKAVNGLDSLSKELKSFK